MTIVNMTMVMIMTVRVSRMISPMMVLMMSVIVMTMVMIMMVMGSRLVTSPMIDAAEDDHDH